MSCASAESLRSLFQDTLEMLSLTWSSFRRHDPSRSDKAAALGRSIHKLEKELTARLLAAPADAEGLHFIPRHLERVGDSVEGLIRCLRTMAAEESLFTDRAVREVNALFEQAVELLECARAHKERLIEGVCMPRASSAYLAILDYLREAVRHTRRIADRVPPVPTA